MPSHPALPPQTTDWAHQPKWAIRPLVPDSVYTDRQEHLDYFYRAALNTLDRRTMTTVLLGQRRMGKTEIFKRVVNRLFFEQEHYADPARSVVPVFYTFSDSATDRWEFSLRYTENFIRWYGAFRLRDATILLDKRVPADKLLDYLRNHMELTEGFGMAFTFLEALQRKAPIVPVKSTLMLPREVSDHDESSIVLFLDEFQNIRLPQYDFDIVGHFHESVESPTCPHFVTGSAMTILSREILGRGTLYGRFWSHPIETMTPYFGAELALKAAHRYQAELSTEMAPVVAERCGCNPFYITAVVRQAAELRTPLHSAEALEEVLAVDVSSGFIWGELADQVNRWIERVNEHGITKWVLYLSAIQEGKLIDPEEIRRQIKLRDARDVPLETIREVLIRLSRGDLVEHYPGAGDFSPMKDPILVDFLKVWGRITVEKQNRGQVEEDLAREYQMREKRILDHLGYLGEVYMAQILWSGQRSTLPGRFFHRPEDLDIPSRWRYVWHRSRLGGGKGLEADIHAAAGGEVWMGESKWWRGRKAGKAEVETLFKKGELLRKMEEKGLRLMRLWFFAHDGFTSEAEEMMQKAGVLYSDRDDLNALLTRVGLRTLPEL